MNPQNWNEGVDDNQRRTGSAFRLVASAYGEHHALKISLLCMAILIGTVSNADAYIDPGSGILIWQALIAALFGGLFYMRSTIRHVIATLRDRRKSKLEKK